MPRYYFDFYHGDGLTRDEQGQEFASLESVRREAIQVLPEIARDDLPGSDHEDFAVKVRDESGRYIFEASLSLRAAWLDQEASSPARPGMMKQEPDENIQVSASEAVDQPPGEST